MTSEDRRDPLTGDGSGGSRCPEAERLAEYVDGVLGVADRADVEAHLAGCQACRVVVAEASTFVRAESADQPRGRILPFRTRRWVTAAAAAAAAAAVVVSLRIAPLTSVASWFGPRDRPGLHELVVAMASEPRRPTEGRLTGGFKYAPPPSPTRGPGDREPSLDVRIAQAQIEKLASQNDSARNKAALGVACLALGDLDKAITTLEEAVSDEPANASFLSDLSAAYIARASRRGSGEDWSKALASADQAIEANQSLLEAFFNRALALQELRRFDEARAAWADYLSKDADPDSPWCAEARQKLSAPH